MPSNLRIIIKKTGTPTIHKMAILPKLPIIFSLLSQVHSQHANFASFAFAKFLERVFILPLSKNLDKGQNDFEDKMLTF